MPSSKKETPKVGVIIGSGACKSIGSIELLKFFEEAEIEYHFVSGCSGGAFASIPFALQMTFEEAYKTLITMIPDDAFSQVNYRTFASIANLPFTKYNTKEALLHNDSFFEGIKAICRGYKIEDLPIKTIVQVTDFETGESVSMEKGDFATAIMASGALMPALPPVEIDGRLYFDGAYSNSVPIIKSLQHDLDIIINLSFNEIFPHPQSTFQAFDNLFSQTIYNSTKIQRGVSLEHHHHEIFSIDVFFDKDIPFLWDIRYLDKILACTKKAIDKVKDEIYLAYTNYDSN